MVISIELVSGKFYLPVEPKAIPVYKNGETVTKESTSFSKLLETLSENVIHDSVNNEQTNLEGWNEIVNLLEEISNTLQISASESSEWKEVETNDEEKIPIELMETILVQLNVLQDNIQQILSKNEFNGSNTLTSTSSSLSSTHDLYQIMAEIKQTLQLIQNNHEQIQKVYHTNQQKTKLLTQIEEINNSLSNLLEQVKANSFTEEKTLLSQQFDQVKQLIHQSSRLVQNVDSTTNTELDSITKANQNHAVPTVESANFTNSDLSGESNQKQMDNSMMPTSTGQAVQNTGQQHSSRFETSQVPTLKMTNIIEELSALFRGSFRLNRQEQATQLRVNIFPEQFGHLDIRLTSIEGKIHAQIFASHLYAKEALDQQLNQLRNALTQQGVDVDTLEVTYQNQQQSFDQQMNPEQRFWNSLQMKGTNPGKNGGYQESPEETTIKLDKRRSLLQSGVTKVDYTI